MDEETINSGVETEAAASAEVEANTDVSNEDTRTAEHSVPVSALQAERQQRQQAQEELRMMKEHMSLLQSSSNKPKEKSKDDFEGLEDSDVFTVGDFKKVLNKFNRKHELSIEELKMTQKHPDYQEVILKYLPEVLKENPSLKNTLQQSQDYELAYYLAKKSDKYKTEKREVKKSADAQRIIENSQKTGSLSSVGGTSPISLAKRYKEMSDDEFRTEVNKNMGYM